MQRPSGWAFPARTTAYFIVVAALSMGLLAAMGLSTIRSNNQEHSEIRLDRAARSAVALFESENAEFVSDRNDGGSPLMIRIDSIDRLEPNPDWNALLDTVSRVNQGAANLFRFNSETASFDRISTTFRDPEGVRAGGSDVEPGLIVAGHPAYASIADARPFMGEVPVAGRMRYAYLTPIVDSESALVGVLAVDVGLVDDLNVSNSEATKGAATTMLILLVVMAASGVTVMFFAFRPLNRLIKVAHDVGSKSKSEAIELTGRRDEIGYLASGLTKVVDLQRDLEHRAYTDDLTGIANRAAFVRELEGRLSDPALFATPATAGFGLLLIDLDSFKEVNDALGHQAGDDLLVSVSESLAGVLEPGEFLARLGGDEFALLTAPGSSTADVLSFVAERIQRCVLGVPQTGGGGITVTASVGAAIIPEHGDSIHSAMTNADLALYSVKRDGRGHAQVYQASLSVPVHRGMHLATELRTALAQREIRLEFQPIYGAADGRLCAVEALARWTHAVEGPISPVEFIGVAEKAGLIEELGHYVIHEACAQIARWSRDGGEVPVVAVNVSTMQLWQPDFVDRLREAMSLHEVGAGELCIEITESVVMQRDDVRTRTLLDEIVSLGVDLSIDDFGTGYSSLSYLHDLPVQQLKIDRMFLAEAVSDVKQAQLFAGIVSLGLNLGLEIVAEGVETSAELELVRRHGCHLVQGWFLDRSMPADAVAARFGSISGPWLAADRVASTALS